MTLTHIYNDNSTHERARLGDSGLPYSAGAHDDLVERFTTSTIFGSRMPLDLDAHWDWRNPLNIIPAIVLLLFVIALVAAIV